jgi:hypothetical protein
MKVEIRYSWRQKWAGRTVTSRIKMTEERALAADPEAVRIEGSREEVVVYDQPAEIMYYGSPANFGGPGRPWQSLLHYPCHAPGREGKVPLRGVQEQYQITQVGSVWTVVLTGEPPLLVYQGDGPVFVEVRHDQSDPICRLIQV